MLLNKMYTLYSEVFWTHRRIHFIAVILNIDFFFFFKDSVSKSCFKKLKFMSLLHKECVEYITG